MSNPIDPAYLDQMNAVASALEALFNPDERKVAFVLLTAEFGKIEGGRVNYISNGKRDDIVAMMKELVGRFESRVSDVGGAA